MLARFVYVYITSYEEIWNITEHEKSDKTASCNNSNIPTRFVMHARSVVMPPDPRDKRSSVCRVCELAIKQLVFSRAPSSIANSTRVARLTLCQSLISPRQQSRSSSNLPQRWQTNCNRIANLLVSELFLEWQAGSKRSLSLRSQFHKMQHGGKMDLIIEKESCPILDG